VSVGGWSPLFATPLVHPFYWSDKAVMGSVGRSLAKGWQWLNTVTPAPSP
jgi:hypothetical protein